MSKKISTYVCQECGSIHSKWHGKCEDCGSWNSLVEEIVTKTKASATNINNTLHFEPLNSNNPKFEERHIIGIGELDRVLGGGIVGGSAILIGGDPGIGKSTLLLQLVYALSHNGVNSAYVSGEESLDQVRLRSKRINALSGDIKLLSATNVKEIVSLVEKSPEISLLVIDSIQTMYVEEFSSSPGTVSQVRAATHELINFTKSKNIILILVGHVTKEGQIAGPKVLEHMVDTVLYFEGERGNHFRILRTVKNRFGPVNEIGVFEMADTGLSEVKNPSSLFLSNRSKPISGSCIFAGIEGTRPLMVEVQALIAPSNLAMPRRSVVGWDPNRLSMILAVLTVRYGISFGDKEVYLNIAGGLKINEPALDLAVIASLISAATNIALDTSTVIFGEVGLSGEVRMVSHTDIRLKEAEKLGFTKAIIPQGSKLPVNHNLEIEEVRHIKQLKSLLLENKVLVNN